MAITLFGIIELTPLWRSQNPDEDYLESKLLLQVMGMLIAFWSLPIWFLSNFNVAAYDLLDRPSILFLYLSNYLVSLISGLLVTPLLVYLLSKYTSYLDEITLKVGLRKFRDDLREELVYSKEESQDWIPIKIGLIFTAYIIFGFVAGVLYFLIFILPIYLIYFFLIFIFVNFVTITSEIILFLTMILSWIINLRWLLNWRLRADTNKERVTKRLGEYQVTSRSLEIIASNKEPVICSSCRSFVAMDKNECPVCGEDLS